MNKISPPIGNQSWGEAYVTSNETPNIINGKLFEIIEALGFPEKQEESIKSLVRKTIWDCFEHAIHITNTRHDEIRKIYKEARNKSLIAGNPTSAI